MFTNNLVDVYHVFLAFNNFSLVSTTTESNCASKLGENKLSTSISGECVPVYCVMSFSNF